ncbi:MAG: ATP-binding protein, partial [Gammaproteobacteria bacterium]|nr:ATP-binding protein [Gammaproteobacteria bacterium]
GFNGDLTGHELQQVTQLQDAEQALMLDAAKRFTLSPRAMHKVLRVARTIADLNNTQNIDRAALLEALGYRDVSLLGQQ